VVKLNDANEIVELVEKPQDFVAFYYWVSITLRGRCFKEELQNVLDNNIQNGGEVPN
jgi:glucose-1-phosphate thymidylyltransferase